MGESYSISNADGKSVLRGEFNGEVINTSKLANGIYFLKVEGSMVKFIVK